MKKIFLCLTIITTFGICCKDEPTKPTMLPPPLSVSVEEVGTAEIWLKIKLDLIDFPAEIQLIRDDQKMNEWNITVRDTLIVDWELLNPGQTYDYKIQQVKDKTILYTSEPIRARTLDSTSHNLTIVAIDTLGTFQSYIKGIWASDPNNAYAVGYFNIEGPNSSIAHWDGTKWRYLLPDAINGSGGLQGGNLNSIYGISKDKIWVAGRGSGIDTIWGFVAEWNGKNWKNISPYATNILFNKVWATSESNVWVCGQTGELFNYDGKNWRQVQSGTTFRLTDIDGTSSDNVYCVGYSLSLGKGILLHYNGTGWGKSEDEVIKSSYYTQSIFALSSRWALIDGYGGTLINRKGYWEYGSMGPYIAREKVRGLGKNDFYICGHFALLMHHNGSTIKIINTGLINTDYCVLTDLCVLPHDLFVGGYDLIGIVIRAKR